VWQDAPGFVGEVAKFVCGKMLRQQRMLRRCVVAVSWLDQGGVMMDFP